MSTGFDRLHTPPKLPSPPTTILWRKADRASGPRATTNMAAILEDQTHEPLIGVESILPIQFWGTTTRGAGRGEPERRLMLAVLQDAILTVVMHARGRSRRSPRVVDEVRKWFASDARSHPFAFGAICDALGLDVSYIRTSIRRLHARTRDSAPYRRDYAGRGRHQVERLPRRPKG